jgi:hypothetical protein
MTHLACPKCRQAVSDDALDAGWCPSCGYDGAMIVVRSAKGAWLGATAAVVGAGIAVGAFLLASLPERPSPAGPAVAVATPSPQTLPASGPEPAPAPRPVRPAPDPGVQPPLPAEPPLVAKPPKRNPWNPRPAPRGPVVRVDAKEVREKQLDNPDGTAVVTDMNRDDRLTLTGRVRLLRIGSVGGKAVLDASKLVADEVIITGDLHAHAVVTVHAPGGRVTVGGHVKGNSRLTVNAPGGEMIVAAVSGKLDGHAEVTVVAKDVDVQGTMSDNAKLIVTLTGGGNATVGPVKENAAVVYKPKP